MSKGDGSIIIDTELDESGLKNGLGKLDSTASKALKGVAAGLTAVGVAAVAFGKSVVSSYADYEQLVGGVDTLFKESSKNLQQYADNAYKTAGLSANQYMDTVTSFSASLISSLGGDTEKAVGYADRAITDMADNANKFGSSMESIQNAYQGFAKQNYTMLDNLKLGYGGTKEEMQRLLEEAEKISGIKFDISSFADITQAIHIIQESMGVAGATAEEAEETISGSISMLKASWQNFITGLANSDADVSKLASNVVRSFKTVARNTLPVIDQLIDSVPGLKAMGTAAIAVGVAFAGWKVGGVLTAAARGFQMATLQLKLFTMENTKAALANVAQVTTLKASEIAVGALTGKITVLTAAKALATKAQLALTAAWLANPVGIVIAAVAALTVGIIALAVATREEDEATKKLNAELEESKNKREALSESMADADKEYSDSTTSIAAQALAAQNLVDKLRNLEAANDGSTVTQLRMKNAVAQLNEIMPELGVSFDETSGKVVGLTDDLNGYIAKLKETALQEAMNKKAATYAESAAEATIERIEAEARLQDIIDAGGHKQEKYNARTKTYYTQYSDAYIKAKNDVLEWAKAEGAAGDELNAFMAVLDEGAKKMGENGDAAEEQAAALQDLGAQYGMTADQVSGELKRLNMDEAAWTEMQEKSLDSAKKAIQDFAIEHGGSYAEIEAAVQKSGLTAEEWVAKQEDAYKRAAEALSAYTEDATQLFDRIETKSSQSIGQVTSNLDANKNAVEQYSQDLLALDGQIDANLFSTLQEQGPEKAAATARMLANASESELEAFNEAYTAAGEAGLNAYETVFGEADTSKSGEAVADSTAEGIENSDAVKTAAEKMIDEAHKSAIDQVNALDFSIVGKNMMDGIIEGITSGTSNLLAKIREAVAAAHAEAKKADDQASPSKWWRQFGLNDMEGWAEGFRSGRNRVISAQNAVMSQVHTNAISQMQNAILGGQNGMRLAYAGVPAGSTTSGAASAPSAPPFVVENFNVNTIPDDPQSVLQRAHDVFEERRWD